MNHETTKHVDVFEWSRNWAQAAGLKTWSELEIDSTNTVAKQDTDDKTIPALLDTAKVSRPSIYLCRRQTQGRGRGSHTWETPPGSALLSSWSFALAQAPQPVLSPQVGLALFEAASATWPTLPFNLKAPNDLFLGKLKVAGVLIETVDWGSARRSVIGVGMNATTHPIDITTATSLAEAMGDRAAELLTEAHWDQFLTAFCGLLSSAMLEGQKTQMQMDVRDRLKLALNLHPLLKEPIHHVDELGQLHSSTRTIHWHEL